MTTMMLDVFCATCLNGHQAQLDLSQMEVGTNRIKTECPHCGDELIVAYELRPFVIEVQSLKHEYPRAWRLRNA